VVSRRCTMQGPCGYALADPAIAGRMPASWSVEQGRLREDGRVATWFFDRDPAGNFKLIGLNQPDGDNCQDTALGSLCEFTPYIATDEFELIRSTLRGG
jgi:Ca-activated chloride channel family protein